MFKDNEGSIIFSDQESGNKRVDADGTLHITGFLPSDQGKYKCVGDNGYGQLSANVNIKIKSKSNSRALKFNSELRQFCCDIFRLFCTNAFPIFLPMFSYVKNEIVFATLDDQSNAHFRTYNCVFGDLFF